MEAKTIYVCSGCGSTTTCPESQLLRFQDYGYMTCCPERRMIATAKLPEKLAGFIVFDRIPDHAPAELKADHPWCWRWSGRQNRNGYGRIRWMGREPVTHRLIWTILRGEVDRRIVLDHRCRNRLCCNPNHLEPVDNRTNVLRGEAVLFKRKTEYGVQQ